LFFVSRTSFADLTGHCCNELQRKFREVDEEESYFEEDDDDEERSSSKEAGAGGSHSRHFHGTRTPRVVLSEKALEDQVSFYKVIFLIFYSDIDY
jgi:hypothetical protein